MLDTEGHRTAKISAASQLMSRFSNCHSAVANHLLSTLPVEEVELLSELAGLSRELVMMVRSNGHQAESTQRHT